MGTVIGGLVALLVGSALAAATIVGVVQTQSDSNPPQVKSSVVSYGSN